MTAFDCPACMPEDLPCCDHSADAMPLATALARHFQATDEPTREQMGWFLDDAGTLLKDAGPGPYTIRKLDDGWHSEHAFLLNNLVVTIGEGGKDCPAQPEVVAKFPADTSECQTPRGSWGTCIQALAAGWILPGDLCPACTASFRSALEGIGVPLKWCPAYLPETEEASS